MAFNYIPSGKLDGSTEQLLERIDNFPYSRLEPYSKLGDIHAQLTVEVVDDIPVKKRTIILTLGELKKQLEEIKKRNEEIKKIREDELQKNLEEEKDEMKWREAMSMREFLPNEISTMNLEDILNEHSDDPDTTEVSLPINERIDGYYTRDHNNKGLIVLANRGRSEQTIAMTYVHELMHAYYDCGCNGSMNDIEYVEEPLAELGMLRFMEQFHFSNPAFQNLFYHCYFSVKNKQNSIGFVHYGFGAELFDCYNDIFEEECMMKRHTFDKNALGSLTRYYQEIKDILKLSWPNDKDRHTVAQNIWILLKNDARFRLDKPNNRNGRFPYVFFFRSKVYLGGPKKNWKNIKLGERVIFQEEYGEWITEQSRIGIFVVGKTQLLRNMLSELQNSLYCIITKVCEYYCEVECYIRPYKHIDYLFLNYDFLAVNIPAFCDAIHIEVPNNYSRHHQLQITVDSNNISFEFDKKNHVLVDKRWSTLVFGYSNSKIPDSIRRIGDSAFEGCTSLTSITIPDGITEIGDSAFEGCTSLTSITIPDGITEIGDSAFNGCTSLTSINIPKSVTKIGRNAFAWCINLTSIVVFDSVSGMKWHYAFNTDFNTLSFIIMPYTVAIIKGNTLVETAYVTSEEIPDSVTKIVKNVSSCVGLIKITIPGSGKLTSEDLRRAFKSRGSLNAIIGGNNNEK